MKKSIFLLLVAMATVLCGCSDSSKKPVKIGVSIPAASHGWTGGVVYHAKLAASEIMAKYPDTEVIVTTGQNSAEQNDRIENLLGRGVKALVVMSQEPTQITPVCEQAVKQGVYLAVVSNPLSRNIQNYFVNGDNRSFGRAAADAIGKLLAGRGDIVMMEGIPCPINTERAEAFRSRLAEKFPGIKLLDSQPSYWNSEKGLALMENYFQKYPKIDAVWAGDDDVAVGVLQAVREAKRRDLKYIVGGGGSKMMVKLIMDGDLHVKATVSYPPQMIAAAMNRAAAVLHGEKTGEKETVVNSQIIDRANAAKHYYPDSIY